MDKNGKLIIFDMDGVLTDSEPAITKASIETLAEHGVTAQHGDFKQFTGMGDDIFIGGVARKYGLEYDPSMKARAYEIYLSTAKERVTVYPWSKEIINTLHKKGYALAVASASDIVKVKCNLNCIGIDTAVFSAIVTGSDVERKKPAPDIFLKAAEKAGYEPKNCLVAEDAVAGVMAAKAAGMKAVAVTTSFAEDKLKEAGADEVTDDLSALPGIADVILSVNNV